MKRPNNTKKGWEKREDLRVKRIPFAKKSFGQNFLVDDTYIRKIVDAVGPSAADLVIEIGPGRGALTTRLLEKAGKVIALELDRDLHPFLTREFGAVENFQLIDGDALHFDFAALAAEHKTRAKLVANLPYNISTAILQRLIDQRAAVSEMVLMFQREVVERITAPPGSGERGFLTVLVEAYLDAEHLFDVPPQAFRPAPKVYSSVARLMPREEGTIGIADPRLFRRLVSAGFAQKRKTILNNLKNAVELVGDAAGLLESAGIEPRRRAETLTLDEWKSLYMELSTQKPAQ
jgi:16S rRNA (adenine1518-N6/adenine1519-N6)-dimethyltransferase